MLTRAPHTTFHPPQTCHAHPRTTLTRPMASPTPRPTCSPQAHHAQSRTTLHPSKRSTLNRAHYLSLTASVPRSRALPHSAHAYRSPAHYLSLMITHRSIARTTAHSPVSASRSIARTTFHSPQARHLSARPSLTASTSSIAPTTFTRRSAPRSTARYLSLAASVPLNRALPFTHRSAPRSPAHPTFHSASAPRSPRTLPHSSVSARFHALPFTRR